MCIVNIKTGETGETEEGLEGVLFNVIAVKLCPTKNDCPVHFVCVYEFQQKWSFYCLDGLRERKLGGFQVIYC